MYSGKVVVFGQNGCIWERWFYSGNVVSFGKKVVVSGQKWLYSGKVVVFGQNGCIREGWL